MPFMKIFIILTLLLGALNLKAEPVSLEGTYDMQLTINNHVFNDIMVLKGSGSELSLATADHVVTGEITVPQIFTVPLNGTLSINVGYQFADLKFSIVAKENGQEFNVFYEASIKREDFNKIYKREMPITFYGTAYLDNRKVLGTFKAVRRE